MLAERRHQLILRALRSGGTASVADLAEQLDASAATIRRGLLKLEADGLLTRVHGGAVVEDDQPPFDEAAEVQVAEKDAIAGHAATLIEDGQSIILDSGTTVHRLALRLRGRRLGRQRRGHPVRPATDRRLPRRHRPTRSHSHRHD